MISNENIIFTLNAGIYDPLFKIKNIRLKTLNCEHTFFSVSVLR